MTEYSLKNYAGFLGSDVYIMDSTKLDRNNYIVTFVKSSYVGCVSIYVDGLMNISSGVPSCFDTTPVGSTYYGNFSSSKVNSSGIVLFYTMWSNTDLSYSGSGILRYVNKNGNNLEVSDKYSFVGAPYDPNLQNGNAYIHNISENSGVVFYQSSGFDERSIESRLYSMNGGVIDIGTKKQIMQDDLYDLTIGKPMYVKENKFIIGINKATSLNYFQFVNINNGVIETGNYHLSAANPLDPGYIYPTLRNSMVFSSGECGAIGKSSTTMEPFYQKLTVDCDNELVSIEKYTIQTSGNKQIWYNGVADKTDDNNVIFAFNDADSNYEVNRYARVQDSGLLIISSGNSYWSGTTRGIQPIDEGNVIVFSLIQSINYGPIIYSCATVNNSNISSFVYGVGSQRNKKGYNFTDYITYCRFTPIYEGQYYANNGIERIYGDISTNAEGSAISFYADADRVYKIADYFTTSTSENNVSIIGSGVGYGLSGVFSYDLS